jgi:restriction endonuclease
MNYFLDNYPFKNKPYMHQAPFIFSGSGKQKEIGLFAEMGTGKSFMLINNAAMLYDKGKINAMLIVAPKGVYRNWYKSEIPKHMPEHVSYKMACWTPSPRKAEKAEMEEMINSLDKLRIMIMNVEAFSTEKGTAYARTFLRVTSAFHGRG